MSLLLLADSQIERVWLNVRNNREAYRSAIFVPVKNFDQLLNGFNSIQSTVSLIFALVMFLSLSQIVPESTEYAFDYIII